MGIFDFIKKQFIDVIEWSETEPGVLVYKYPMQDQEIQNGASLTVRESQKAVFINEGKLADVFDPGMHTLSTQTLPVLTYLKNWDKAFQSPFKSDVFFFSMREQLDLKWGTQTPITIRDKEFGPIRLRANGSYSFRLSDVKAFWSNLSGNVDAYKTEDIQGQLRAIITTTMASFLGNSSVPFIDMASNQTEFSESLKKGVAPAFAQLGLELGSFYVQSLSLPEELQQYLDKASSMRMVGDLQKYAQFQTADSISIAAANPGGVAGAGAGLGAGLAMGQMMAGAMNVGGANSQSATDPIAAIEKIGELLKKGLITQSDYDSKKDELLKLIK